MYRGCAAALSSVCSILRRNQTLSSLLPKKQPYLLSSLSSHGVRSVLFEFPKMEDEARLFLVLDKTLVGIKISELIGLGKEEKKNYEPMDWEYCPSPPFDLCEELPDRENLMQHHFVLDSKLYLAGGGIHGYHLHRYYTCESMVPPSAEKRKIRVMLDFGDIEEHDVIDIGWCKIYEFDVKNKKIFPADSNSIPPPPTPLYPSFLGNISGHDDVYCLAQDYEVNYELQGFWVLSSSSSFSSSSSSEQRMWKRLPYPPSFYSNSRFSSSCWSFVFQGKLFLRIPEDDRKKEILYSFDPTTSKWKLEEPFAMDDSLSSPSWPSSSYYFSDEYLIPSVSLSLNNRTTVALSSCHTKMESEPPPIVSYYYDEPSLSQVVTSVTAIIMNNKNGGGGCGGGFIWLSISP